MFSFLKSTPFKVVIVLLSSKMWFCENMILRVFYEIWCRFLSAYLTLLTFGNSALLPISKVNPKVCVEKRRNWRFCTVGRDRKCWKKHVLCVFFLWSDRAQARIIVFRKRNIFLKMLQNALENAGKKSRKKCTAGDPRVKRWPTVLILHKKLYFFVFFVQKRTEDLENS